MSEMCDISGHRQSSRRMDRRLPKVQALLNTKNTPKMSQDIDHHDLEAGIHENAIYNVSNTHKSKKDTNQQI